MKIILLEDITALGKLGDVVSVRAGYARNYLFPQHKAERANPDAVARFAERRTELEKRQKDHLSAVEKMRSSLDGYMLQIIARASPDGNLYGSVTAQHIAESLNEQKIVEGLTIKRGQVLLPEGALKGVGDYPITVRLYIDCEASVTISILADSEGDKNTTKKDHYENAEK